MAKFEKSIEIKGSPEKVWPIVSREKLMELQPEWKRAEWISKDKNKAGLTLHMIGEVGGYKAEMNVEFPEWTENEKLTWRTKYELTTSGSFTIDPTKVGSKYTVVMEYELPHSLLGKVIDKLRVHKVIEKNYEEYLKKLKDAVENELAKKDSTGWNSRFF